MTRADGALVLLLCCGAGAAGAARAEDGDGTTLMRGRCRKLTTPAADLTAACRTITVRALSTREGRVGFHFVTGDVAVTFSGSARAIRVADGAGVQTIDKVAVTGRGPEQLIAAVGSCRYANLPTPRATVNCRAETEEGNFLASFDIVDEPKVPPR